MFLEDFYRTDIGKASNKLAKSACTYNAFYIFWRDNLFERVMRIFEWEGTNEVRPKEIEMRLHLAGHCGITMLEGELTAMFGSFYGVTKYLDEWKNYTVRCPIYSGTRTIGKDIIIIDNNKLRNPTYAIIHHYATLLAHNEVTMVNTLVNARDSGGIPIASTEKQKKSIQEYLGKLFDGQYGVVTDIGNLGIQYAGTDRKTGQSVVDLYTLRERILRAFYSDIGVKSSMEKRANIVIPELGADDSLLTLNISDMLSSREECADNVNKMFGTHWKVHINKCIDYEAIDKELTAREVQKNNVMDNGRSENIKDTK